ncbi:MAG TPA: hypothetical protein VFH61_05755 [Thermoleophilia bacterium]|nr:hypothetical protein [Thermoleophilia bacterium]
MRVHAAGSFVEMNERTALADEVDSRLGARAYSICAIDDAATNRAVRAIQADFLSARQ